MSDLEQQLAHCDGKDCKCMAYYSGECACDADWTPAEVYRLRAERDALQARIDGAPVGQSLGMVIYHDDETIAAKMEGEHVALVVVQ